MKNILLIFIFVVVGTFGSSVHGGDIAVSNNLSTEGQAKTDDANINEQPIYISLFWGNGCPHCEKEKEFLNKLKDKYPNIELKYFEIYNNADNRKLLIDIGDSLGIKISGVPFLLIGDEPVSGYFSDEITGRKIENIVAEHMHTGCKDVVSLVMTEKKVTDGECSDGSRSDTINLPGIGETDIGSWSLPLLTIIIAAFDGFNPCAMWVLLFLISLLLGMKDRRRMWILGITFIVSSGFVYFLFLSAWLNLFLFIGVIASVRIFIGLIAILSGSYHLREWHINKSGACKVGSTEQKKRIIDRLRSVTEQKTFWLAFGGIIVLAFAVNLIELVCSAGLPAIYTQILSMSDLSGFQYYLYLLLYIAIFMLDDMLVFVIAMTTLKAFGFDGKYSRWSNLVGGIVILILGILLIFKPDIVMLG